MSAGGAEDGPRIAGLFVHPVKSCGAVALERAALEPRGPRHDRRWAVVGPEGVALTQREEPRLALVRPRLRGGEVELHAPGAPPLRLATRSDGARRTASVWGASVAALAAEERCDAWITAVLGRAARFAYMDRSAVRPIASGARGASESGEVSFADELPLLVCAEASLAALEARAGRPLGMERFRPNLVVAGAAPFAEDGWRRIAAGSCELELVRPAGRCVVVTIDQRSAERDPAGEPLATLARWRPGRDEDGRPQALFGVRARVRVPGELAAGDPLRVLEGGV